MAGKTIVGTEKHERALRWMKNEVQSIKNRMGYSFPSAPGGSFEPALGDPLVNGYVLSSTTAGVRAWVASGAIGPDLTAIEALAGTGIAVRTAADTWAQREIAVSGNGLNAVTNPAGVAGNPTLSLNIGTGAAQVAAGDHAHAGVYDPAGTAAGLVGTHESTYNHPNYNTAYSWGNHAGLYSLLAHTHAGVYEPVIAAGTTLQYWRGDKSWQTLNQAAVAGLTTASSPSWVGATLSGLTASLPVVTDGSKNLASLAYATFKANLAIAQADVSGLTTASSPAFVTVKLSGLTDGYIPYHVSDAAGLANSVIFQSASNVGIGTTGPATLLHVDGGDATLATFDGGSTAGNIVFSNGATPKGYIGYGNSGSLFSDALTQSLGIRAENSMHLGIGGAISMTLISGGNIGIGTTAPGYPLHVVGNSYFSADVSALTFTDRTPYPKDKDEAWAAIKSMKMKADKNGIDHATLHPFLKSEWNIGAEKDEDGREIAPARVEVGRNMSATLSALVEAAKDLDGRLAKVEKTH